MTLFGKKTPWGRREKEKGYTEDTKEKDGYIYKLAEIHPGLGNVRA